MENYELTIVMPGSYTPAKQKNVAEKLKKLITTFKGKETKKEEWGKLDLAYPINKETSGAYYHYEIELVPEQAKNVSDKLRLDEDVIRYLLIRKD